MAIPYEFDSMKRILTASPTGSLEPSQVKELYRVMMENEEFAEPFIEIVDFTGVTVFPITSSAANNTTFSFDEVLDSCGLKATIFFCSNDLQFGMARMLTTFYEIHAPRLKTAIAQNQVELEAELGKFLDMLQQFGEVR